MSKSNKIKSDVSSSKKANNNSKIKSARREIKELKKFLANATDALDDEILDEDFDEDFERFHYR